MTKQKDNLHYEADTIAIAEYVGSMLKSLRKLTAGEIELSSLDHLVSVAEVEASNVIAESTGLVDRVLDRTDP